MELKPGSRWKSAVCDTEVVVVRPPKGPVTLECGGQPMVAQADAKPEGLTASADRMGGSSVGKRYTDESSGIELLCSKAGAGSVGVDGRLADLKAAKPLPASD